jgi:anti-sigma regulatory factor (Ser/Thr protein kinase)
LHQAVNDAGYSDLVLDFHNCSAAFAGPMLALCAQVMKLRLAGVEFELIEPDDAKLARLFRNANWSHFLDPKRHDPSCFQGHTQVPATQFRDSSEQQKAVNRIVNAILGAMPDLSRRDLRALEWSVNEVTDNVLNHADSCIGGLVQVSTFQRLRRRIEYIVADAGMGIPASLKSSHPDITSDAAALDRAIREGVTRDISLGQGNGLFGSYQICSHSNGFFQIESGYGRLAFTEKTGLRITTERIPYDGTLVAAQIDFSVPFLLEEALQFGGRSHIPTDYVELTYETEGGQEVVLRLSEESNSFGSRMAGAPIRTKLRNLAAMCPDQKVCVDFDGVALVSSSFADEVIGKLFAELGPMRFMQRFEIRNMTPTVRQLVDRAIAQRLQTGLGGAAT